MNLVSDDLSIKCTLLGALLKYLYLTHILYIF